MIFGLGRGELNNAFSIAYANLAQSFRSTALVKAALALSIGGSVFHLTSGAFPSVTVSARVAVVLRTQRELALFALAFDDTA